MTIQMKGCVHHSICSISHESHFKDSGESQPDRAQPGAAGQGARGHLPPPWTEKICHSQGQSDTGESGCVKDQDRTMLVRRVCFSDISGERMNQTEGQIPDRPPHLSSFPTVQVSMTVILRFQAR